MSHDLEVRRLTNALLREGLDAEQVLDSVLRALSGATGPCVVVETGKQVTNRPTTMSGIPVSGTMTIWTVRMVHVAPLVKPVRREAGT